MRTRGERTLAKPQFNRAINLTMRDTADPDYTLPRLSLRSKVESVSRVIASSLPEPALAAARGRIQGAPHRGGAAGVIPSAVAKKGRRGKKAGEGRKEGPAEGKGFLVRQAVLLCTLARKTPE